MPPASLGFRWPDVQPPKCPECGRKLDMFGKGTPPNQRWIAFGLHCIRRTCEAWDYDCDLALALRLEPAS